MFFFLLPDVNNFFCWRHFLQVFGSRRPMAAAVVIIIQLLCLYRQDIHTFMNIYKARIFPLALPQHTGREFA